MPNTLLPRKRLRVGFLLADQFTLSAFANFVDVLRLAADEADKSRPILGDWCVLSPDMAPVRSSCGVKVTPDRPLRTAERYDYIVVVGGLMGDHTPLDAASLSYLRAEAGRGTPLVGLCTGVFILQEAELLRGYRCCVSWFHHQDFLDRFDRETPVSDQIFVVDRDRLTCSGGHGAAHLAAFLVARHIGEGAAIKSLNIMMIDDPLSGERPQPGQPASARASDPLVRRALLLMQQSLATPRRIEDLARDIEVGRRTLERRFLADLGQSPSAAYLGLRLDRAEARLCQSTEPITAIALACGFCDAPHLSRALKSARGVTPAELRRTGRQATAFEAQPAVAVLLPPGV